MSQPTNRAAPATTLAALASLPPIAIGSRLTNYGGFDLQVAGLAQGGMGLVVWGPNAGQGGQMIAAKLPRPDRLREADAHSPTRLQQVLADFEHEALVWCHLWAHPCIITANGLLRLAALGNLPVLILDYAPQGSLRAHLQRVHQPGSHAALSLEGAFAWGQMIAAALAAIHQPDPAHERPDSLVHCDLKPENVLIDAPGWALLTDLGLTRALAALAPTTVSPTAVSPDAAQTTAEVTAATDPAALARMAGLTPQQQAQAQQLRALLAQAGVTLPASMAVANAPMAGAAAAALYATRTVRVPNSPSPAVAEGSAGRQRTTMAPSGGWGRLGSRGAVAGTPPYMAPEQWLGLDAVEPATDVYALGVVLFELFAGVGGVFPHDPHRLHPTDDPLDTPLPTPLFDPWGAWYAAHRQGPSRRLSDPDLRALTAGPLRALVEQGAAGRAQAEAALAGLDALIDACLAPHATARPSAAEVQRRLGDLAAQVGLTPVVIPEVTPHTPANEGAFWGNLGITYGNVDRPDEKLRLLRRAVALDDANLNNWQLLANALQERANAEEERGGAAAVVRGLREEAVATYAAAQARLTPEALARWPHLASSLPNNLGNVLDELGRYAEAVAAYERALAVRPDKAHTRFNLANAYRKWAQAADATPTERLARLTLARAQIQQALAIAPHLAQGRELQALIEAALAAAQRALAAMPSPTDADTTQ